MKNKYGNKRGKKLIFVDDTIAYLDCPRKCTENFRVKIFNQVAN